MTIATVVTRGYGSFGSIEEVVTRGYIDVGAVVASLAGTALAGLTEAQIVAGGETIIVTLANDTWVASGATFDAQRQNIIDGLTSAQSEVTGWNNEVRDNEVVTSVVRTSDTVVTITLSPAPGYDVTSNEAITLTIPSAALVTSGSPLVASPSVSVTADVQAQEQRGGRTRRRRYLIEIDGKWFDADSIAAAQALLDQAEEVAKQSAQRDVVNAPQKIRIKPPKVKVTTAAGNKPTSVILSRHVAKTQRKINKIYLDAHKEVQQIRETAELMHKKIQKEEDEAILMLIL